MARLLDSRIATVSIGVIVITRGVGLIITPSFVCHNSQDLRNETYDILIKNTYNGNTSGFLPNPAGNLSGLADNHGFGGLNSSQIQFQNNLSHIGGPAGHTSMLSNGNSHPIHQATYNNNSLRL